MTTYINKLKCLDCGLHYIVYSEHEHWPPGEDHRTYCPECGSMRPKLRGLERSPKPIFEFVSFDAASMVVAALKSPEGEK